MKRIISLCVLLGFLLAWADDRPAPTPARTQASDIRRIGEVSLGVEYYHYKEPRVMSISGPMLNIHGFMGVIKNSFRFQTDFYFATHVGANIYDGAIMNLNNNTITPYKTQSTDFYVGGAPKIGFGIFRGGRDLLFAYVGLGYRFLSNLAIDAPNMKTSYRRYQGYLYLPIGLSGELPLSSGFSLTASSEYRILLFGHNASMMTDLNFDDDLFFRQNSGYGTRVTWGGKFYVKNGSALKLDIYCDYWDIKASNVVAAYKHGVFQGNFTEPKNFTLALGLMLGYRF